MLLYISKNDPHTLNRIRQDLPFQCTSATCESTRTRRRSAELGVQLGCVSPHKPCGNPYMSCHSECDIRKLELCVKVVEMIGASTVRPRLIILGARPRNQYSAFDQMLQSFRTQRRSPNARGEGNALFMFTENEMLQSAVQSLPCMRHATGSTRTWAHQGTPVGVKKAHQHARARPHRHACAARYARPQPAGMHRQGQGSTT